MSIITNHFQTEIDSLSVRISDAIIRRIKNKDDVDDTQKKLTGMKIEEKLQVLQILETI